MAFKVFPLRFFQAIPVGRPLGDTGSHRANDKPESPKTIDQPHTKESLRTQRQH